MLKIRRSRHHLIFNMGVHILVRRHLYMKTAPCSTKLLSTIPARQYLIEADLLQMTVVPSLATVHKSHVSPYAGFPVVSPNHCCQTDGDLGYII